MVTLEELRNAHWSARRNKSDSNDMLLYERHLEMNMCKTLDDIKERRLSPKSYSFPVLEPKPREVFACGGEFRDIHHYIDIKTRDLFEKLYTDRTFNNRIGFGPNKAIEQLKRDIYEVTEGYVHDAVIIKVDIAGFFPNANRAIVCSRLVDVVRKYYNGDDKDDIIYMIEQTVLVSPICNCEKKGPSWMWDLIPPERSVYGKPDGIGGAIGYLIWQNGMNFLLNDIDHWLLYECGVRFVRFVDDIVIVDNDKERILALLPELRERLSILGCKMHPKKFYCQPYQHGVEFIGHHIKFWRSYVNNNCIYRFHKKILLFNRCPRANKVKEFISSMNSYLGIMKHSSEIKSVNKEISYLNKKWFIFVHFDEERRIFVANDGYKDNDLLCKRFELNAERYKKKKHRK